MSHTPGPWTNVEHKSVSGSDYIQILSGSWDIAHNRFSARDWDEEKANARLIAAAPDMLEALQACIDAIGSNTDYVPSNEREARDMAIRAVHKAQEG